MQAIALCLPQGLTVPGITDFNRRALPGDAIPRRLLPASPALLSAPSTRFASDQVKQ